MKLGLAVALCVAACGGKKDEPPAPVPVKPAPVDAGAGSGSGSDVAPPEGFAAAKESVLEKRYEECWSFYNDSKYDQFKGCFAANGVNDVPGSGGPALTPDQVIANLKEFKKAMPNQQGLVQLAIASGSTVIGVALLTGTQTGPMEGPGGTLPATNKKVGIYMGQVLTFDDKGKVAKESDYFDGLTMMGQLQPDKFKGHPPAFDKLAMPRDVVVALGDAQEKANLAAVEGFYAAYNKRDDKAALGVLADDLVWTEQAADESANKAQMAGIFAAMWKGFSDAKLTVKEKWAAGPYVVVVHEWEGTHDTDVVVGKETQKKTGKHAVLPVLALFNLEGGKIKRAWWFYQSSVIIDL